MRGAAPYSIRPPDQLLDGGGELNVTPEICGSQNFSMLDEDSNIKIKNRIEAVEMNYAHENMSNGMARGASLALQLSKCKHTILLYDTFKCLDHGLVVKVTNDLVQISNKVGMVFLLK